MVTKAMLAIVAFIALEVAVTPIVGAQQSDDGRFEMIEQCKLSSSNNAAYDDSAIQYDKALAAGTLSDNFRDVQDAYHAIAECYGDVAGHLILALPAPCHEVSDSCLSRTETVEASQAYNCANRSAIRIILNVLNHAVDWFERTDAMGTEPGTRMDVASAQKDLKYYQQHACRS
jgi:hypothetical protein